MLIPEETIGFAFLGVLVQCFEHSWCSVNSCWTNEWDKTRISVLKHEHKVQDIIYSF